MKPYIQYLCMLIAYKCYAHYFWNKSFFNIIYDSIV